MCGPTLVGNVGVGLQAAGVIGSTLGAYKQSKANQRALEQQAKVAEYQAKDAEQRGTVALNKHRLEVAQLKGRQRAAFAARGLALDEGSALNILLDTDYMSDVDEATIKDNTAREAWALRNNAAQLRGRAAAESPLLAASSTFLTGATGVAKSWYALREKREGQ